MSNAITNLLCYGNDSKLADMLARNISQDLYMVTRASTEEDLNIAIAGSRVHAILLPEADDAAQMVKRLRNNIVSSIIPIFYIAGGERRASFPAGINKLVDGIILIDSEGSDNALSADILSIIDNKVKQVFHPVSKLPTGAALSTIVSKAVTRNKKNVFLLMVKLHGLKAYNLYKSYEDGDRLISAVSTAISEIAAAQAGEGAFAGHYASDEFLIFSNEKRMESVCKTIMLKTERVFRSFYTPFELMRGYITLEGEKNTHYYLAEVMIGGIEIPSQWESHYMYVIDLLKDLLKKIEADDMGFRIVKL